MADRTFRSGRDRYDRDRGYSRQAEQFEDQSWRDDEARDFRQEEGWREEDYGQFDSSGQSYSRDRDAARDWGRDPAYRPGRGAYGGRPGQSSRYASFTGNDFGGRDFNTPRFTGGRGAASYGAGSRLAANHGEWRDEYGATPSREQRDYRGTWGGEDNERGWLDRVSDTVEGWFSDDDDYRRRGRGYRGQGPSGYTRSDERISEDVCDRLTDDWRVDARQISVTVSNGEVTLDGTVPSREHKRRAEDCIEDLSGVKHVQNNLRVQERTEFGSSQSNPTSTQA